jgi:predicted transcriptional regulator
MAIILRPEHEQIVAETLPSSGYQTSDHVIGRALERLRAEEQWLASNRQLVNAKVERGLEELNRGEGIPEDEVDA